MGLKNGTRSFPTLPALPLFWDRLLHHADATVIEGESYRMRESEQEAATRRRKK